LSRGKGRHLRARFHLEHADRVGLLQHAIERGRQEVNALNPTSNFELNFEPEFEVSSEF
jgi:hypothetical protein